MDNKGSGQSQDIVNKFQECFFKVKIQVQKCFLGQSELVDDVLTGLFAGGHILLEGVPGTGKTVLAKSISEALGLSYQRIQCTPDLMPSDIIGHYSMEETGDGSQHVSFQPGPVMANYILVDEINRATPKTQSALLEAMQEGQVTVARDVIPLPCPNMFIATQNPVEHEGTYNLPEAQLDRFIAKLKVGYPEADDFKSVLALTTGTECGKAEKVMDHKDLLEMQETVKMVETADSVLSYAVEFATMSNPQKSSLKTVRDNVVLGASPRAIQSLIMMAKVRTLLDGRTALSCKDINSVSHAVLRHRILLSFSASAARVTSDEIIDEILNELS